MIDPNALVIGTYGCHRSLAVVEPPTDEPFTRAQAKLRAGLDWADGDPRDALMDDIIRAARQTWERQSGMAVLEQTLTLFYDAVPPVLDLIVRPLVSITEVRVTLTDGSTSVLDPSSYAVDLAGSRIAFTTWPSGLRTFQPWAITVIAGYATAAEIPGDITQAIGLLIAHWATLGRDLASIDTITELPYGWEDLILPHRPMVLP